MPGINLFEFIDWHTVQAASPCGVGAFEYGPDNRIIYSESAGPAQLPVAGCAEIRVAYQSPFPAHHLHLRFLYHLIHDEIPVASGNDYYATVALEGPGGEVPEASFFASDTLYPEAWDDWRQDPGPGLPLFFEEGVEQRGEIIWRFGHQPLGDGQLAIPFPVSAAAMSAILRSMEFPPSIRLVDQPDFIWGASHIEYSFVDVEGLSVTRERVARPDGLVHDETHFTVHLDQAVLSRYGASIQLEMDPDMVFSHVVLPDGSVLRGGGQVDRPDWRLLRYEIPQFQVLSGIGGTSTQVTIPVTLVAEGGPGTYVVVVARPTTAIPAVDETMRNALLGLAVLPVIIGLVATRNVVRYAHFIGPRSTTLSRSIALAATWVTYLIIAAIATAIGWSRLASAGEGGLAALLVFVFLVVCLLFGAISLRAGDRAIQAMQKDVLERQMQAQALERSNKDLELFAATAAHDLAAPIRSVRGFAEIVQREHAGGLDPEGKRLLRRTVDGAKRMQSLLTDLLEFSREQTGQVAANPVALADACREAIVALESQIKASGADIRHRNLPVVHGWHAPLVRLFQNLLENAMKFRADDRPPVIRVTARRQGDAVEIMIADNGIGIPDADLEAIFRPFHRPTHDKPYEGSGLGLALVQRIVDAHGGRIWAESELSKGSTFHIVLPAHVKKL